MGGKCTIDNGNEEEYTSALQRVEEEFIKQLTTMKNDEETPRYKYSKFKLVYLKEIFTIDRLRMADFSNVTNG